MQAKTSSGKLLENQRVMSNSSVSTMVSECEDKGLQKVFSSGSFSSLASDIREDHEEGGTEFGPIIEEDTMAGSSQDEPLQFLGEQQDWPEVAVADAKAMTPQCWNQKDYCHPRVPKSVDLAQEFSKFSSENPPTTIMIRNIPNRYTRRMLIRELGNLGFAGTFDFLYTPIDKGTLCNVGYAFVNFTNAQWAARCMETLENYSFKKQRKARGKIASISIAHIQGLEANVKHYENTVVNSISPTRTKQ